MQVTIASPSGGASFDAVSLVSLNTVQGQIGVLEGHADLLATTVPGPLRMEADGRTIRAVVGSGVLRIEAGAVILTVDRYADRAPEQAELSQRVEALTAQLGRDDLHASARERAHRELGFLEAWMGAEGLG